MRKLCSLTLCTIGWWGHAAVVPTWAITAGQVNDFQQGGTQGWQEGVVSPNPPQVISSGGPDGDGDAYLQNRSSGILSAGGRMVFFNTQQQWQGNYLDAGITALEVDLNNQGNLPLTMRFRFLGPGGDVYTQGVEVLPGSGWQRASFSLDFGDLFPASDAAKTSTLSNVSQLWFIHNPSPSDPGPPINGLLGIDNIRAVGQPVVDELPGDYNGSGTVEQGDLDLVLLHWGSPADPPPAGWVNHLPMGTIDQEELDGVLLNWGNTRSAGASLGLSGAAVPEPAAWVMAIACGACLTWRRFIVARLSESR